MSLLYRRFGCLCLSGQHTQIQHVRNKSKQAARLKQPKTIKRMVFNAVTEPIIYRPVLPLHESCSKAIRAKDTSSNELTQYEKFLVKEGKKLLHENQMIAFCHASPMSSKTVNKAKAKFKSKDIHLLRWPNNKIMREAVNDTKFVNLVPYFQCTTSIIVCKHLDIIGLVNILKKTPELTMMGLLIGDRILSPAEVDRLSAVRNIESARGEFVSILKMAAGQKTHSLLCSHQQELARNIEQYAKQCREEGMPKVDSDSSNGSPASEGSGPASDST